MFGCLLAACSQSSYPPDSGLRKAEVQLSCGVTQSLEASWGRKPEQAAGTEAKSAGSAESARPCRPALGALGSLVPLAALGRASAARARDALASCPVPANSHSPMASSLLHAPAGHVPR